MQGDASLIQMVKQCANMPAGELAGLLRLPVQLALLSDEGVHFGIVLALLGHRVRQQSAQTPEKLDSRGPEADDRLRSKRLFAFRTRGMRRDQQRADFVSSEQAPRGWRLISAATRRLPSALPRRVLWAGPSDACCSR